MPSKKSEIRKSYLLNKYVVITPGRAKRPKNVKEETVEKKTFKSPFLPENITKNKVKILDGFYKKGSKKDWDVISIGNIFPAVSLDNKYAYGTQEVIIETPDPTKELADLSDAHLEKVLQIYANRTKELAKKKKLDYILCFKNQGSKAGASLIHAHSQVFATQIVPEDLKEEAIFAMEYVSTYKRCPYCDIIEEELKSTRKVYEDKYIAAFTPFASEYHYEVWIFPKRHVDNISLLTKTEFKSLTKCLKMILTKLQALNLSFNYFLHNVISNPNQHFYIKVQPRDSVWAGVELGSGLVINSISPEIAAKYYKK